MPEALVLHQKLPRGRGSVFRWPLIKMRGALGFDTRKKQTSNARFVSLHSASAGTSRPKPALFHEPCFHTPDAAGPCRRESIAIKCD